jgi:hypothetical protein
LENLEKSGKIFGESSEKSLEKVTWAITSLSPAYLWRIFGKTEKW